MDDDIISPEMQALLRADASAHVGRQGIQLTEKEKQFEAKVREILAKEQRHAAQQETQQELVTPSGPLVVPISRGPNRIIQEKWKPIPLALRVLRVATAPGRGLIKLIQAIYRTLARPDADESATDSSSPDFLPLPSQQRPRWIWPFEPAAWDPAVGGLKLIEGLVTVAITIVMIGILLPAVQSAREAARRTQCMVNLKQIMLGVMNYESGTASFPWTQGTVATVYPTINNGQMPWDTPRRPAPSIRASVRLPCCSLTLERPQPSTPSIAASGYISTPLPSTSARGRRWSA